MGEVNHAAQLILEQLEEGSIVWVALFGALFFVTVFYLFRGIYIYSKRSVESTNFVVFCVPIIVWAFLIESGPLFGWNEGGGVWLRLGISAAGQLIPVMLMLHIRSQVSYRPITAGTRVGWLAVPILLIANEALTIIDTGFDPGMIPGVRLPVLALAANAYFIIVIVQAYLLCFNVFYQMPKHMRRSTHQMLVAITAMLVARGISVFFVVAGNTADVLFAIALIIAMHTLYTAFFIANSSNVIVTSRDFVFSNLSTIVITVSLKGNILDWNHKDKNGCYPLPDPKYKEPYPLYRKRILEMGNGTVSPHYENILNIKGEDGENHFLFTWHDISYFGRKFGYLVEIAEVTSVYSKLRYFEDIAYYDNLTSLNNRNAYIEYVKEVSVAENMPLLIMIGDVNNLKKINDTYGHLHGDKLLMTVTKAVKDNTQERAFLARIGGDELVLLLPNADERDAVSFIASVTESLNAIKDPKSGTPSVSWGYSFMQDASENYNDVFRAADAIMYEAKKRAREISISGVVPQ